MVNIILYQLKNFNRNDLKKNLTGVNNRSINGYFYKYDTNTISDIIFIFEVYSNPSNLDLSSYTYASFANKYYFVEKIECLDGKRMKVTLHIDVLMTYSAMILASTGTVTESENNKYLNTRSNVYDIRPKFAKLNFSLETPLSDTETNNIIMITTKGNI